MKTQIHFIFGAAVWFILSGTVSLPAQTTAFTYQGRLNDGGSTANGIYDLRFAIYDSASSGVQQGNLITNSAVAVSNGLFTVAVDFGNVFPGANRFLEIAVRTNGAASFFTLNPRQALTPAPYAITAGNVISGGLAAGSYGNAVTLNNSGNNFSGAFNGNGGGLTNLNAATLNGQSAGNFWQLGGNGVAGGQFLGSTNNQPVELWVNNARGWRLEPGLIDTSHSNAVNVVGGSAANFVAPGVSGATISGGGAINFNGASGTNSVASDLGVIGGGLNNSIQTFANVSAIGGGFRNSIQYGSSSSVIGGGSANLVQSNSADSFIGGGSGNTANGTYATVVGGSGNVASNLYSTVVGGANNTAGGNYALAGGNHSTARGPNSVALGASLASGNISTAMGESVATGLGSTAMGLSDATGDYSTAMGYLSSASGLESTAFGTSSASGTNSVALGASFATNTYAFAEGEQSIAGGVASSALGSSYAFGDFSAAMGQGEADGYASTAAGYTKAAGDFSTALGGSVFFTTEADGQYSFAAGCVSKAAHDFSFVWSDGYAPIPYSSTGPNQFLIHANGGVGIGTNAPAAALHVASALANPELEIDQQNASDYTRLRMQVGNNQSWEMDVSPGATPDLQFWNATLRARIDYNGNFFCTAVNPSSDRNLKENFAPISTRDVLEKVAALPITRWNFKTDPGTVHLGPMAQDFHAAFDVGTDDKHIATVDEGGVALAAIQGLNEERQKEEGRMQKLEQENAELKAHNEALEKRLEVVEKIMFQKSTKEEEQ